jgi:hypothetical protein
MTGNEDSISDVHFANPIAARTPSVRVSTEKPNQNIRINDVAKRDTARVMKRTIQAQEWSLDINPHKSTKKAKAKERQAGKKEIRKELKEK